MAENRFPRTAFFSQKKISAKWKTYPGRPKSGNFLPLKQVSKLLFFSTHYAWKFPQ